MSQLPDYVVSAKPNPQESRAGWLTTTAATYAGVMLWFVFWQDVPNGGQSVAGGTLSQGLGLAIGSLVLAAFLCHFLFYLAPGLLGLKTGLPLAVVGTSTYGVVGGYLMPGLLMGLLQFGWLSVNAFFSGLLLAAPFGQGMGSPLHLGLGTLWALIAMFMGLKGIQYVGKVASFMPIIPIAILLLLLTKTIGTVGAFSVDELMKAAPKDVDPVTLFGNGQLGVLSLMCAYVIGFFATAGAAGVGFGSGNKNQTAVQFGGLVGIVLPTVVSGIIALIVVAGAQKLALDAGKPEFLSVYQIPGLFDLILGKELGSICMFLLAIAAFPSACFCTLIAADCIKTSFPKINPWVSCGVGVAAAIALVISGLAGKAGDVFTVIGASFGPICGAMAADYILSGFKWAGPRAGFNPAGWLSWLVGFAVGGATLVITKFCGQTMPFEIPCPPLSAFIVGFVLYTVFAQIGLQSKSLDLPQRIDQNN
ncbi:MAG: cytosine permease [Planctomycetaceae bacterium]|jgi:cytosine permease|nr:cytosine permease [Planctomycetaceae bacterium]